MIKVFLPPEWSRVEKNKFLYPNQLGGWGIGCLDALWILTLEVKSYLQSDNQQPIFECSNQKLDHSGVSCLYFFENHGSRIIDTREHFVRKLNSRVSNGLKKILKKWWQISCMEDNDDDELCFFVGPKRFSNSAQNMDTCNSWLKDVPNFFVLGRQSFFFTGNKNLTKPIKCSRIITLKKKSSRVTLAEYFPR